MPWRGFGSSIHALPAGFLALVLLVEPLFERRKIVQDGGGIHLALAADGFQRVRPGLALAHAEHLVQALTGGLVFVDRAAMQRALNSGGLAERAVKLELQDAREKVTHVRCVGSNVILCAGIKVSFAAVHRRRNALIFGL